MHIHTQIPSLLTKEYKNAHTILHQNSHTFTDSIGCIPSLWMFMLSQSLANKGFSQESLAGYNFLKFALMQWLFSGPIVVRKLYMAHVKEEVCPDYLFSFHINSWQVGLNKPIWTVPWEWILIVIVMRVDLITLGKFNATNLFSRNLRWKPWDEAIDMQVVITSNKNKSMEVHLMAELHIFICKSNLHVTFFTLSDNSLYS